MVVTIEQEEEMADHPTSECPVCGKQIRFGEWIYDDEPISLERGVVGWRPHVCGTR